MPDRADADLDELVDLDDDGGPAPRGRLPRWTRSRWALPAAVTAVVVLVGVAGLQQARASAASEVERVRRMASVQLGAAAVDFSGAPASVEPDADGQVQLRVQVGVRNTGDTDLQLLPVSTSVEHAELASGARPVSLRAGTGGVVVFDLAVDCDAVPPLSRASSDDTAPPVSTDLLRLAVTAGGRTAERDYLLPETGWGGLSEQLTYACSPNAWGQSLSSSTQVGDDGRQTVELFNSTDEPVRVELQTSPALRTAVVPALPAEVPPNGSLQVVLTLDPDCSQLGEQGQRDPYSLQTDLVYGSDGETSTVFDTTATAAWVARQVALRCG